MTVIETLIGSPYSAERVYRRPAGGLTGPEGRGIQRTNRFTRHRALSLVFAGFPTKETVQ